MSPPHTARALHAAARASSWRDNEESSAAPAEAPIAQSASVDKNANTSEWLSQLPRGLDGGAASAGSSWHSVRADGAADSISQHSGATRRTRTTNDSPYDASQRTSPAGSVHAQQPHALLAAQPVVGASAEHAGSQAASGPTGATSLDSSGEDSALNIIAKVHTPPAQLQRSAYDRESRQAGSITGALSDPERAQRKARGSHRGERGRRSWQPSSQGAADAGSSELETLIQAGGSGGLQADTAAGDVDVC